MHRAIETYLNEELDLEIKGDWQVFRFEYPVFDRDGNPVLDKNGKQVTKGRMLDFMGFQFHHDRTTIRKSNIESARRKANHISKQDKISWYNASVMLSYMGLFKHTDTYNYYIDYIKPKINVKKLKRIVSKHSRKENEHDRLEKVTGTQPDKPEEVDRTSSPSTVYLRKNIEQVTREVDGSDGKIQTVTEWQYDEKEMTVEEYENMALMKSVVEENTSGIVESVTQFQKDAVIDEYTQQLIEEGLI